MFFGVHLDLLHYVLRNTIIEHGFRNLVRQKKCILKRTIIVSCKMTDSTEPCCQREKHDLKENISI